MASLEGNIEYWDNEGNLYNPKLKPLPKSEQLQNNLKAFGMNAYNWLNDEDFDSPAYQQKLGLILGLEGLGLAATPLKPILPYIGDFWLGRNLLFNKDYKQGKSFYKKVLHPKSSYNPLIESNKVSFPNSSAGKIDIEYMDQFPFLRYNMDRARSNQLMDINKNRLDADTFNNLKVRWKGKDYAYQIKNNKFNKQAEFHNIKPYSLIEEEIKDLFNNGESIYGLLHKK